MKKALRVLLIILIIIAVLTGIYLLVKTIGVKGIPSDDTWDKTEPFNHTDTEHLIKKAGEDYKILLFSDIQTGQSFIKDPKAFRLMDELVGKINPDFIMTTGDNTYSIFSDFATKPVISRLEDYGIPWGVVLGNHDSDGIADRNWIGNQYESADNSLFRMGPDNVYGVGNYVVTITDENDQPVYALIMMDSNDYRKYEDGRDYDYIHKDQIYWYEWVVRGLGEIPSILTFHIPVPEFKNANDLWKSDLLSNKNTFGENRERIFCAPVNSGMFDKVLELENTTHIFVGHDHINSLSIEYMGVRLTYGLKTGPTCYADDDMQGATLITIKDGTNEVVTEHIYVYD